MNDLDIRDLPTIHREIESKSLEIGFSMPSDLYVGTLLKTLVTSKPGANILELGTGIGMSLSWMIDGMDSASKLTTVDNDPELVAIATQFFGHDDRVELVCADASEWIINYSGNRFDLIFADAWPGKYSQIDEILDLVSVGGFYIVDDMMAQLNWPEGHVIHVERLIAYLEQREDFSITKLNWSTGLIIAVKRF
jgi:predicted O-methyltransferase YrrM